MKHYTIKQVNALEYQILQKFLYEALFQPDPKNLFPFSIVETAELNKYIDKFGQLIGDYAIASYDGENPIGLVWVRLVEGYGHVDSKTPELNISILSPYRGKGIGRTLLQSIFQLLKDKDYKQVSLSVQKANRALTFYLALGFEIYTEDEETFTMIYSLINND